MLGLQKEISVRLTGSISVGVHSHWQCYCLLTICFNSLTLSLVSHIATAPFNEMVCLQWALCPPKAHVYTPCCCLCSKKGRVAAEGAVKVWGFIGITWRVSVGYRGFSVRVTRKVTGLASITVMLGLHGGLGLDL